MKLLYARISPVFFALLLGGCATTYINPTATQNPPPAAAFGSFDTIELATLTLNPDYQGQDANTRATSKIETELKLRLDPLIAAWNQDAANRETTRGRLLIEPHVRDIKFISGGVRFWAGAMAGSSAVIIDVIFRDADSGEVIAKPEFYQHANAYAGAWTIGTMDNAMLIRIAELIAEYTRNNFSTPVGGPTGAPSDRVQSEA